MTVLFVFAANCASCSSSPATPKSPARHFSWDFGAFLVSVVVFPLIWRISSSKSTVFLHLISQPHPMYILGSAYSKHPICAWGVSLFQRCTNCRMETASPQMIYQSCTDPLSPPSLPLSCEGKAGESGSRGAQEDTMLNDILFVAGMFATRIVLPVLFTFVIGNWVARRIHPAG